MTEAASKREITLERILLHELIHRINNEFSSLIGAVSRTAARSANHEVKVALAHIIELLSHYAELHRALRMPERDTHIDVAAYLENLCLSDQPIEARWHENSSRADSLTFVAAIGTVLAAGNDGV